MSRYSKKEKLGIEVLTLQEEKEHFHQDIELIYIIDGSMDVFEGEEKEHLGSEDIIVINANKKHGFTASKDILYVKLMINYDLVSDIYNSADIIYWCNSVKDEKERFDELRKVIRKLLEQYLNNHGEVANFGHIALCYQIMDILSLNFLVRAFDKEQMNEQDKYNYRMLQINNYIRNNYDQPISLKDLADKLYLSHGYLSRFFKNNYGMNFAKYLTNIRLFHASDDLLYTNASITRIASDNGFTNVSVFNKEFKRIYGEPPSALRKKLRAMKQTSEITQNIKEIEKRLEQYLREDELFQSKENTTSCVEAEHDVMTYSDLVPIWRNLINIGSAEDLLRSEVREHVIILKEGLKFEYIRFWNIFSEDMLFDINSKESNFSRLDSILDFLVQLNLKPHIDLGQKPKRVQKNVQSALIYHDNSFEFSSMEQWDRVITSLIRHLSHRYGRNEIDTWRLELWYDERFLSDQERMGNYFTMFQHTYDIVRKYSNKMEVGGCGFRMDGDMEFNISFIKHWKQFGQLPDFISILNYAYERGEKNNDIYAKRSTDVSHLLHAVRRIKSILKHEDMDTLRLYISEWNITISDRNYINDSCFKGAYIIKNIMEVCHDVDSMGYFLGSDRISEYFDSNALLHGGMGLIAKDSIYKPSAFAFELLNRLYPYCVGQGDNYLLSTDGHHNYGLLCHNYKKLNYNYYFTKEDELEKENIWKYFEERDTLQIKLALKQLPAGEYQMRIYRINEHSGSILDLWCDMNFEKELTREDIKYFRRVCEPKLTMEKCKADKDGCNIEILMSANEIAYILISKIE